MLFGSNGMQTQLVILEDLEDEGLQIHFTNSELTKVCQSFNIGTDYNWNYSNVFLFIEINLQQNINISLKNYKCCLGN